MDENKQDFYREVGERMEQARLNKRMKRTKMSEITGIHVKRIERMELGAIPVTMHDAAVFAKALDIDPAAFFPPENPEDVVTPTVEKRAIYYIDRHTLRTRLSKHESMTLENTADMVGELLQLLYKKHVIEMQDVSEMLPYDIFVKDEDIRD